MTLPTAGNHDTATPDAAATTTEAASPAPASQPGATNAIDDKAVAAWLASNPSFFHQHPDLLLQLSIPHESGRAISLLERQVAVFRTRQGNLQDQIHEFIGNARANDNLFEKTRSVVLELLRCATWSDLKALVEGKLLADFNASASALVFVSDEAESAALPFRRLATADMRTALGDLFAKQRTYCGALNSAQQRLLFAGHARLIVSAAIVPLHLPDTLPLRQQHGLPLLLIGSTEELHFNGSLDTLFLDFIGEVLAVHMQNLAVHA